MSSIFVLLFLVLFTITSTMASSKESAANNPGLQMYPDKATGKYFVQHSMLRIRDPKASLDFYTRIMGMSLLKRFDFTEPRFTTYLMGYVDISRAPSNPIRRMAWTFGRRAVIELTHNWGTETNSSFKGYHNGNTDPLGYGHIGINVDDVQKAIKRFESLGVVFVRRPENGNAGIAFIQDPDGYWIEIYDIASVVQTAIDNNAA